MGVEVRLGAGEGGLLVDAFVGGMACALVTTDDDGAAAAGRRLGIGVGDAGTPVPGGVTVTYGGRFGAGPGGVGDRVPPSTRMSENDALPTATRAKGMLLRSLPVLRILSIRW